MNFGSSYAFIPKSSQDQEEEIFEEDLNDGLQSSAMRDEDVNSNNLFFLNNQMPMQQQSFYPQQQQSFYPQQQQQSFYPQQQQSLQRKTESKKKLKSANTNVIGIELGKLENSANVSSGDAYFCKECKSMINKHSVLTTKENSNDEKIWKCEFCGHENVLEIDVEEIPKEDVVDYLIESAQSKEIKTDDSAVLFILDNSGSMGTRVPQSNLSRLQCVVESVQKQIESFKKDFPNKKVGLITFSDHVTIYGDGSGDPIDIKSGILEGFDQLYKIGQKYNIENTINDSFIHLQNKLKSIKKAGYTALGPGLAIGLGMIKNSGRGNTIVLLTDGLANIGYGNLEGKTEKLDEIAENFYTRIGEVAKENGITINITSIEGTECKMDVLGKVTEITNGEVDIVNPLELSDNFGNILAKKIVATECKIIFNVHRGLNIQQNDGNEKVEVTNTVEKQIGNVTNDLVATFEYSLKSFEELKKYDFENLKELPFQVQIYYRDLKGAKKVRSITKRQPITYDRKEAEKTIDVNVISAYGIQASANLAKKGKYQEARQNMIMNQKMLKRNINNNPIQQNNYQNSYNMFINQAVQLDNALLMEEQQQKLPNFNSFSNNNNQSKQKKSDFVSKNIYQCQNWNTNATRNQSFQKVQQQQYNITQNYQNNPFNFPQQQISNSNSNNFPPQQQYNISQNYQNNPFSFPQQQISNSNSNNFPPQQQYNISQNYQNNPFSFPQQQISNSNNFPQQQQISNSNIPKQKFNLQQISNAPRQQQSLNSNNLNVRNNINFQSNNNNNNK